MITPSHAARRVGNFRINVTAQFLTFWFIVFLSFAGVVTLVRKVDFTDRDHGFDDGMRIN